MIKPNVTKNLKVIDKNITSFQSSALNYIFVPVSSEAKIFEDFNKEVNKKWTNLEHQLKLWKAAPREFKSGCIKLHSVQSNAVVIFAYCLNDDNSVNPEALTKCVKEIATTIKYNDGCMNFSKKLSMIDNLEEFIKETFIDKNISCYLFK